MAPKLPPHSCLHAGRLCIQFHRLRFRYFVAHFVCFALRIHDSGLHVSALSGCQVLVTPSLKTPYFSVFIGTWNVGNEEPNDLSAWLQKGFDLY